MTRSQADAIIARLDAQSEKIDRLQSQIDTMRGGLAAQKWLGGLAALKWLGGLLGVGGIGALLAWLQSQGK
jgi:hypothetical protein